MVASFASLSRVADRTGLHSSHLGRTDGVPVLLPTLAGGRSRSVCAAIEIKRVAALFLLVQCGLDPGGADGQDQALVVGEDNLELRLEHAGGGLRAEDHLQHAHGWLPRLQIGATGVEQAGRQLGAGAGDLQAVERLRGPARQQHPNGGTSPLEADFSLRMQSR